MEVVYLSIWPRMDLNHILDSKIIGISLDDKYLIAINLDLLCTSLMNYHVYI